MGTKLDLLGTRDTVENVSRCLICTVPPELCDGNCDGAFGRERVGRPSKCSIERVAQMVLDGWTNKAIQRELQISKSTLNYKKKLCREAGLLT